MDRHKAGDDDLTLKCWGLNTYGQLGQGDQNDRGGSSYEMGDLVPAISLGTGRTAVAVSAGGFHTTTVPSSAGAGTTMASWG
ncbi:hypothetical protein T484DRAFT_1791203 [Baffinella frigidus]|nr:hypothetical protein T484DRAFT_1791203 [Cryptophyta sp. CCMP2293]